MSKTHIQASEQAGQVPEQKPSQGDSALAHGEAEPIFPTAERVSGDHENTMPGRDGADLQNRPVSGGELPTEEQVKAFIVHHSKRLRDAGESNPFLHFSGEHSEGKITWSAGGLLSDSGPRFEADSLQCAVDQRINWLISNSPENRKEARIAQLEAELAELKGGDQ